MPAHHSEKQKATAINRRHPRAIEIPEASYSFGTSHRVPRLPSCLEGMFKFLSSCLSGWPLGLQDVFLAVCEGFYPHQQAPSQSRGKELLPCGTGALHPCSCSLHSQKEPLISVPWKSPSVHLPLQSVADAVYLIQWGPWKHHSRV